MLERTLLQQTFTLKTSVLLENKGQNNIFTLCNCFFPFCKGDYEGGTCFLKRSSIIFLVLIPVHLDLMSEINLPLDVKVEKRTWLVL